MSGHTFRFCLTVLLVLVKFALDSERLMYCVKALDFLLTRTRENKVESLRNVSLSEDRSLGLMPGMTGHQS